MKLYLWRRDELSEYPSAVIELVRGQDPPSAVLFMRTTGIERYEQDAEDNTHYVYQLASRRG